MPYGRRRASDDPGYGGIGSAPRGRSFAVAERERVRDALSSSNGVAFRSRLAREPRYARAFVAFENAKLC